MRRRLLVFSAVPFVLIAAACAPVKPPGPSLQAVVFLCTGGSQTWTVPPGVSAATFDAYGAQGGTGEAQADASPGSAGLGGRSVASFAVTPGELVGVDVGCAGASGAVGGAGGFNGGGDGGAPGGAGTGGGGGGASIVRRGVSVVDNRTLVAGGGAGGGASEGFVGGKGGGGGAPAGIAGTTGFGGERGEGAGAGTDASGGLGGDSQSGPTYDGGSGGPGLGGDGAATGGPDVNGGGGGGGGLFGGGAGGGTAQIVLPGAGGGGGGGSGFGPADALFETGVRAGHGLVIVYFTA